MQFVPAAQPSDHLPERIDRVAVVSADALMGDRVGEALRDDGLDVLGPVAGLAALDARSDGIVAVVVAIDGDARAPRSSSQIREARDRFAGLPLVVVAAASRVGVHRAFQAGAAGVVLKSDVESALPATVRAVRAGQVVAPRALRASAASPALSYRERETLALVTTGLTNLQIAGRLHVAESTVKTHLASVFRKLGVESRAEAAAVALDPEFALGVDVAAASDERAAA
jgi:DNA-binding NarL/FixJ family response regulator